MFFIGLVKLTAWPRVVAGEKRTKKVLMIIEARLVLCMYLVSAPGLTMLTVKMITSGLELYRLFGGGRRCGCFTQMQYKKAMLIGGGGGVCPMVKKI